MIERPKCNKESCTNPAFVIAYRMNLCGDCYMNIYDTISIRQAQQAKEMLGV